jgi:hypothetical protein
MDNFRHSWIIRHMDGISACLCDCRTFNGILSRVCWNSTSFIHNSHVLGYHSGHPNNVSSPRFRLEIVFSSIPWTHISARRMYYPKQYHYVQEIQKFNVADYRPRFHQIKLL